MEFDLLNAISNNGFSMAVAAYCLLVLNKSLNRLSDLVQELIVMNRKGA